jgi:hypothetical protein
MQHDYVEERDVHDRLADLEPFDRVVTLLAAVLDHDRGSASGQVQWLLVVVEAMSKRLPEHDRAVLASLLVDAGVRLAVRWWH